MARHLTLDFTYHEIMITGMLTKEQMLRIETPHFHRNVYQRERRERHRKAIQDLKERTPCADCGGRFPYYVMDFDHRGQKSFSLASPVMQCSLKTLMKEVAKCDIVCANCHRIRTHQFSTAVKELGMELNQK